MQSILYVTLKRFYVSHLHRIGAGEGRSLVVTYNGLVLDCDEAASVKKVVPGMKIAEAKTILREDGCFIELDPQHYADLQAAWLDTGLIYTQLIEPESPHAAYFDFSAHPHPASVAECFLRDLSKQLGLEIHAGLAVSKWVAKLAARPVESEALRLEIPVVTPVTDAGEWLRGLPTLCLSPIEQSERERLVALGYRRIGQVALAPLDALLGQFGKNGLRIYEAARGKALDRLNAVYPLASFALEHGFENAVDSRLVLDEALKELARESESGLSDRDVQAGSVLLWIENEEGARIGEKRDLVKPVRSERSFLVIYEQLLDRLNSGWEILKIGVLLMALSPLRQIQRSLEGRTSSTERTLAAQSAFTRARTVYGKGVMKVGGELELPRRLEVFKAWHIATGWRL